MARDREDDRRGFPLADGESGARLQLAAEAEETAHFERDHHACAGPGGLDGLLEPAPADRDGRLREVEVKVRNVKDATVRNRSWVIVPKK